MIREWKPVERYKEVKDFKLMKANLSNIIAAKWKTEIITINIFHFAFIFLNSLKAVFFWQKNI